MKPLDHIGWTLWQASQVWKQAFIQGMVARGYVWFAEARANLIHLIGPNGTRQSLIVMKSQMTKQAVQQFLDELERDGIVLRKPDPADARGKLVLFTTKGLEVLRAADAVKLEIEAEYEKRVGKSALKQLKTTLDKISVHVQ